MRCMGLWTAGEAMLGFTHMSTGLVGAMRYMGLTHKLQDSLWTAGLRGGHAAPCEPQHLTTSLWLPQPVSRMATWPPRICQRHFTPANDLICQPQLL